MSRDVGPRPDDAAIVGIGALFPGAVDTARFWDLIVSGTDAIRDVPADRWDPALYYAPGTAGEPARSDRFYCRRGGFVDELATFDPTRFGIMPAVVDGAEPDQLLALRASAEAIADAGGEARLPDRSRIGVVFGRGGYMGVATARLDQRVRTAHQLVRILGELAPDLDRARLAGIREAFQSSLGPERPEASIGLVPSFTASRIANRLDLGGPSYTVDAACATSLLALDQAVAELRSGRCDAVLAGSVHHCHIATLWSVFTQLRALSPSERIRPFDRAADGTLISEGTGAMLLKRLADAERDGDRVYAVVRGVGVTSDGRAASLMSPLVAGQVRALEQAWRAAGLDPTDPGLLGLLEAHGTGTPVGDEAELTTLGRVFGPRGANGRADVALGTVKSNIGHAMQASGIAGLIKAALALHHRTLPPTLHVADPHPAFAATRMRPQDAAEHWAANSAGSRVAAVDAFGFGGANAHAVLEQAPAGRTVALPTSRTDNPPALLTLAADSLDELARALAEFTAGRAPAGSTGRCRLAVADPTPKRLALAARAVRRGEPWRGRAEIWFTPRPLLGPDAAEPGRVALLFPGLEPEPQPRADDLADLLGRTRPDITGAADLIGRAVDATTAGRFLADALARVGVTADVLAGHSVGEWTAMVASGMYPRAAIDTFLASLGPDSLAVPDLTYAALGCGADLARRHVGTGPVVLSHDNCPHQSVVCGPPDAVAQVLATLRREGIIGGELPFRSGFHTPMWEPYLGQARDAFARLPLRAPRVPVWSATSVAPFPDEPEAVRALTVRHLLEPVRFRELVDRLYASGVRAFVQAGAGSLVGFVQDTLRGQDVLAVAANSTLRPGLDQFRRAAAALWVEGAPVDPMVLAAPTAPAAPARAAGATKLLDLGSPVIGLGQAAGALRLAGATRTARGYDEHPVMAAFQASLAEAESAVAAVGAGLRVGGAARPAPIPHSPRSPLVDTARSHRTDEFSLTTHPYVRDHCVYEQPDWWPDDADRFPVLPMTTLVDLAGTEALAAAGPGRVVAGYTDVRALRWLPVEPATTTDVVRVPLDADRVRVEFGAFTSVVVVLADRGTPRPAPVPDTAALTGEGPAPVSARALYTDRWMFHGPRFAGVEQVLTVADDGIRGIVRTLPAPGALLDAAGQLLGHWMQLRLPTDRLVFPMSVEGIDLHGPRPATGSRLLTTARIRDVTPTTVRGDVELVDPDTGALRIRVRGWVYRRFAADERVWPMKFTPHTTGVAEPQPEGWCLLRTRWPDPAAQDLVMRRYLTRAERTEFATKAPRERQSWLLGRVAVKDAVREHLWRGGHAPLYPTQVAVTGHAEGRPLVRVVGEPGTPEPDPPPWVSLAHSHRLAVALARNEPAGIAIALIDPAADPAALERTALGVDERRLLDTLAGPDPDLRHRWVLRFRCAKEAAGRANGAGLAGRPLDRVVTLALPDLGAADATVRVAARTPAEPAHVVQTRVVDDPASDGSRVDRYVVAWTCAPAEPANPKPLENPTRPDTTWSTP